MEKAKDEPHTKLEFEQERKTAKITEILVTAMKLRNIKGLINSHPVGAEANNKVELEFNPLRYVRIIFDLQGGMQIKTFLPSSPFNANNQFDRKGSKTVISYIIFSL